MTDVDYTAGFFAETAPSHMGFAAAAAGHDPGGASHPRRVLELGFGQGFGLALLAAANPDIVFEGYDVNPRHVAHAKALIAEASLANIAVDALSFEEVAARGGARDVDVAIIHGVYAWIGPAARRAVLTILAERMVAGSIVMVSYNCLPGWAPLEPLRQIAEVVGRAETEPARRVEALLDLLSQLGAANAAYFAVNPSVGRHIASMVAADRSYLVHEYFGGPARALTFAEAHDDLAGAGFDYLCSATICENIDAYALPAGVRTLAEQSDDLVLRETIRDIGANKSFRRDLYRRGSAGIGGAQAALASLSFALLVPPAETSVTFKGPMGRITGQERFFRPIFERLAAGVASFAELAALPALVSEGHVVVTEALALLVHARQVAACTAPMPDGGAARRFNRVILERAARGQVYHHLASPVTGSGVAVEPVELFILAARLESRADRLSDRILEMRLATRNGAGTKPRAARAAVSEEIAIFDGGPRQILAALGCLPLPAPAHP